MTVELVTDGTDRVRLGGMDGRMASQNLEQMEKMITERCV